MNEQSELTVREMVSNLSKSAQGMDDFRDLVAELELYGAPHELAVLVAGGEVSESERSRMVTNLLTTYSESELAEMLTWTIHRIRMYQKLGEIPAVLVENLDAGKIAQGTIARVVKLPKDEQAKAAQIFEQTGKLTGDDVAKIRQVETQAVTRIMAAVLAPPDPRTEAFAALKTTMMRYSKVVPQTELRDLIARAQAEALVS